MHIKDVNAIGIKLNWVSGFLIRVHVHGTGFLIRVDVHGTYQLLNSTCKIQKA